MIAIGLMSGTSLDGVDAALVDINGRDIKLLNFITLNYDLVFKNKIFRNLNNDTAKLSEISTLNFELGYKFKEAIDEVLKGTKYKYKDIDFVASHGQTIWHDPQGSPASTFQIGEPSVISYLTNIKTISNFRTMDVAAGGEGAPLVPFSEYYQFISDTKDIVLQNIGGISNLTYLKKGSTIDDVVSFDCGVGNIMIDFYMNRYFNLPYDNNGDTAFSGKIIPEVLDYLKKDLFVKKAPPKSTGREQYSEKYMLELEQKFNFAQYKKEDIITTITEYTVFGITYNYINFLGNIDVAVINGGGSHNKYIIKRLKDILKIEVLTGEEFGINSDAKEAVAFVILGYMTLNNEASNVVRATGAKEPVILGNITMSPVNKNEC